MNAKLAIQPQVNMNKLAGAPVIEKMLAMRCDVLKNAAVQLLGFFFKPSLWRAESHPLIGEPTSMVTGNPVNRVSFWHDGQRTGGLARVRWPQGFQCPS